MRDLRIKYRDAYVLILADFNAKIGSVSDCHIGKHGTEAENSNGEMLRVLLNEHGLAAVNTFVERGCSWTWTGSRGHHSRIDYILWSLELLPLVSDCWVDHSIELTDCERDDHCMVASEFALPVKSPLPKQNTITK